MKNNNRLLKIFIVFLFFTTFCFGAESSDNILALLNNGLRSWIPTIKTATLWVFWTLVVIDLVWTFGKLALSGFEIGEFLVILIKKTITIGIFIFLFNVDYWLNILFSSFSKLAIDVTGTNITPDTIIQYAYKILEIIWEAIGWNLAKTLFLLICGLISLIGFVLMAIDLMIVYLKFFIMNIVIFFALALGGLERFKEIGFGPILTAIKVGIELFMIQGIMGLCINIIETSYNELLIKITIDLVLQILIISLIFCMITKMIPGLIEAVFSGSIGDSAGASAGFRAVATAAAGVTVGAATAGVVGAVGATKAINAAKQLHTSSGGGGGLLNTTKGIVGNLFTARREQLMGSGASSFNMAHRMREQSKFHQSNQQSNQNTTNISGGISGAKRESEPYHSGVSGAHANNKNQNTTPDKTPKNNSKKLTDTANHLRDSLAGVKNNLLKKDKK